MNQKTIMQVSAREILVSELCASGWTEGAAQKASEHMTCEMYRPEIIAELTQESRRILLEKLNLYSIVGALDDIARQGKASGDYRAAAIATAKLADLLPLITKP